MQLTFNKGLETSQSLRGSSADAVIMQTWSESEIRILTQNSHLLALKNSKATLNELDEQSKSQQNYSELLKAQDLLLDSIKPVSEFVSKTSQPDSRAN
jgi:hypothetical protein